MSSPLACGKPNLCLIFSTSETRSKRAIGPDLMSLDERPQRKDKRSTMLVRGVHSPRDSKTTITPLFMKKNRPGQLISVITDKAKSERLAELLMEETGTLGVREMPVSRHISRRSSGTVELEVVGRKFQVKVKRALTTTGHAQGGKV